MYHKPFFHGKIFCLNIKFSVLTAQETWKSLQTGILGFRTHLERWIFKLHWEAAQLSPTTLLDHFQPGVQQITAHQRTQHRATWLLQNLELLIKVLHQKYLLLSSLMRLNDLKFRSNEFWISTRRNHCKTKGTVPLQRPVSRSPVARTPSTSKEQRIPVFSGIKV